LIILGINYFFHDSSACIVRDGDLVVALEEERFTRAKHTDQFPVRAVAKCLEVAGIGPDAVDHVAVSISPSKHWPKKVLYGLGLGRGLAPFLKHELIGTMRKQRNLKNWYKSFTEGRTNGRPKLHFVEHHVSHIAGSYFVSPYDHAALLSMDGSGEWSTLYMGEAKDRTITRFSETMFPHSLGSFYEAATEFCGFQPNYDEGKTMGLAPFGDPDRFYKEVSEIIEVLPDGQVRLDLSYFGFQNWAWRRCSEKFYSVFGQPRGRYGEFEDHHNDVATAFQRVLEDKVLELCRILEDKTEADYLVIAGGVSLNSVMNGRILRETRFKDLYVMPAAGDNGTAIGAAFCVHNDTLGQTKRFHHADPYVGNGYDNAAVEATLKECKLPYRKSENVCREAAELLRAGNILGWFQGRMEIGPRPRQPQHPRRPIAAGHEGQDQRRGQTPRGLSALRSVRYRRGQERFLRYRGRGALHAQGLRCPAREARRHPGDHPCRRLGAPANGAEGNKPPLSRADQRVRQALGRTGAAQHQLQHHGRTDRRITDRRHTLLLLDGLGRPRHPRLHCH
jgi:carbamoyltransferase